MDGCMYVCMYMNEATNVHAEYGTGVASIDHLSYILWV